MYFTVSRVLFSVPILMSASRKTIPWGIPICGGSDIRGIVGCDKFNGDYDADRSCVCSPPPTRNYHLCFFLAQDVLKKKLHIQKKQVVQSWNKFAADFCALPIIAAFEPVQGQSLRKQFDAMLNAAKSI